MIDAGQGAPAVTPSNTAPAPGVYALVAGINLLFLVTMTLLTALVLLVPSVGFMLLIERFLKAEMLAKIG